MTDTPRPAPQYGEYATPEQQQEIIRRSGGPQTPVAAADAPVLPVAVPVPAAAAEASSEAVDSAPRRRDRFVTIALLAYGLYTVVTTIPQLIDYAGFAELWMSMAGIDADFTAAAEGRTWGITAAVLFAVGWITTALLSWRAIVRGRLSWWIAVVGAVVSFIVVSICLSVPLMSDPAVIEGVLRAG